MLFSKVPRRRWGQRARVCGCIVAIRSVLASADLVGLDRHTSIGRLLGTAAEVLAARSRSHRADTPLWSSRQASRHMSSDSLPIQVSRPVFAWRCPASEAGTAQRIAFWPRAVLANGVIQ